MTLLDRVTRFPALRAAALRAARGHRGRPDAAAWLSDLERNTLALERSLRAGAWRPSPLRTFGIRDPKPRRIAAAPFADCVVHHAIFGAVEPCFEAVADPDSYACRKGRGTVAAVRRTRALARANDWYLKIDVRHCFETIPHGPLLRMVAGVLPDPSLLPLLEAIVANGAAAPGIGLPIGTLPSQHLANLYLGGFDARARALPGLGGWVRYMDDMVAFGPDKATVRGWLPELRARAGALGLMLKDEARRLAPVRVGVPMLGFRVWPGTVRLDAARARRFRRRMRRLDAAPEEHRARSAQSLVAWTAVGDTSAFRRSFFARRRDRLESGTEDEPAPTA